MKLSLDFNECPLLSNLVIIPFRLYGDVLQRKLLGKKVDDKQVAFDMCCRHRTNWQD